MVEQMFYNLGHNVLQNALSSKLIHDATKLKIHIFILQVVRAAQNKNNVTLRCKIYI